MKTNAETTFGDKSRFVVALILSLSLGLLAAVPAKADQISTLPGFGPYMVEGGEFTMVPDANIAALLSGYSPLALDVVQPGTFQTFCTERNEYITPSTTYDVTLSSGTVFSGKPLSVGAAYLYQQFATGQLFNYNYADSPAGNRTLNGFFNAYTLGHAIWYYMGEYSAEANNPYQVLVNGLFGAGAFAPDNGAHNVAVLNLWAPGQPHDPAHAYQDVLIYSVPEPSTLGLVCLAATALWARRRRK